MRVLGGRDPVMTTVLGCRDQRHQRQRATLVGVEWAGTREGAGLAGAAAAVGTSALAAGAAAAAGEAVDFLKLASMSWVALLTAAFARSSTFRI